IAPTGAEGSPSPRFAVAPARARGVGEFAAVVGGGALEGDFVPLAGSDPEFGADRREGGGLVGTHRLRPPPRPPLLAFVREGDGPSSWAEGHEGEAHGHGNADGERRESDDVRHGESPVAKTWRNGTHRCYPRTGAVPREYAGPPRREVSSRFVGSLA